MSSHTLVRVRQPADLTLEAFEQIVWGGSLVVLDPALLHQVAASRARMMEVLEDGRDVYGVTTGMGYLAGVRLSEVEQQNHQANLLLGRAVGRPPFLERDEARAVLLARLAGFLSGHAGVAAELCQFLAERLNDDFVPAIPREAMGCAGEIIPLSHAFQTFIGVGEVVGADGVVQSAHDALAERGVAPYRPASKEGIALLAGAPAALALTAVHRRTAAVLSRQLLVATACAIDAMRAPLSPYDPAVAQLAGDLLMSRLLEQLGALLSGSDLERPAKQAPVSFRVIPQVLTHLERVRSRVEESVRRALAAVTDSPAFVDDRFVTNGGFHAIELAAGMDSLCIALVQAAELASQHIHRLLDHRFTGLPDQLTPLPGLHAGLVVVHKRVVGTINELRRLVMPATIGLMDTSLGQEDAMTFSFEAAEKLRRVESLLRDVIACQLLVVRQAWALRDGPVATGLHDHFVQLASAIPPVEQDRPLGSDIGVLVAMLHSGTFQ
ncbi:MAG: aromatic amino acid lyase [Chloroflexota bacterium]|nr:aromatic amino acid lyase [Chloroflexota bacterium]